MREVVPLNITAEVPLLLRLGKNGEAGRAPQRSKPGLVSGVRDSPERSREGEGFFAFNLMYAT
jgi:hypothetical protein